MTPSPDVISELAPTGRLRAGINLGNFLLVTGTAANGDPQGVSPDMAGDVAARLGVPVEYVCFASPGAVADAATQGAWDIANIGAEPQRAEQIAFTAAYCEIECTYLVPAGSPLAAIADVDRPGNRVATMGRAAYGLWLENNLSQAELVRADTMEAAMEVFVADNLDAMTGLRPRLIEDAEKIPGSRVLDGKFSAVQQAIGTPRENTAGAAWLASFVEEAKATGRVAELIARHDVKGLSVAPSV